MFKRSLVIYISYSAIYQAFVWRDSIWLYAVCYCLSTVFLLMKNNLIPLLYTVEEVTFCGIPPSKFTFSLFISLPKLCNLYFRKPILKCPNLGVSKFKSTSSGVWPYCSNFSWRVLHFSYCEKPVFLIATNVETFPIIFVMENKNGPKTCSAI